MTTSSPAARFSWTSSESSRKRLQARSTASSSASSTARASSRDSGRRTATSAVVPNARSAAEVGAGSLKWLLRRWLGVTMKAPASAPVARGRASNRRWAEAAAARPTASARSRWRSPPSPSPGGPPFGRGSTSPPGRQRRRPGRWQGQASPSWRDALARSPHRDRLPRAVVVRGGASASELDSSTSKLTRRR